MATVETVVHLSDLHFGYSDELATIASELSKSLWNRGIDQLVVTGDLTDRGQTDEYEAFLAAFGRWIDAGRLTAVPGNHDRVNDDIGRHIMANERVKLVRRGGLDLVLLDSTGPHNQRLHTGHGQIDQRDLEAVAVALAQSRPDALVGVLMHHHPDPLPEETSLERLSSWVGLPYAKELGDGSALLELLQGRADLLLHGHRHVSRYRRLTKPRERPLRIFNAGCSPALGRARVFRHCAGRLLEEPRWIGFAPAADSAPARSA